jgi:hypothetical protein
MDNRDFLDGIDEQFQRLMKQHRNGKSNGRLPGRGDEESVTAQIIDQLGTLTRPQRQEVLAFIKSLKQKAEE